jgi:methylmalonyl-CoA/ethylmalonyl-CoA epimerase
MVRIKGIDHVAVCVTDIDDALAKWRSALGVDVRTREVVASQRTEAALLPLGDGRGGDVELISPARPESGMAPNEGLSKFLEKRGPGLHHIAVEVEGIEEALAMLKAAGIPLIDEAPRLGARGHKVAFLHPRATGGVLVELVEPIHAPSAGSGGGAERPGRAAAG